MPNETTSNAIITHPHAHPKHMKVVKHLICVVRSHHLVFRLGVDAHHARVAVGGSLAMRVFVEKGLHISNICFS